MHRFPVLGHFTGLSNRCLCVPGISARGAPVPLSVSDYDSAANLYYIFRTYRAENYDGECEEECRCRDIKYNVI